MTAYPRKIEVRPQPTRKPWPLLGYAPGHYMCQCSECGERFEGNKRASMCLPCAADAANTIIGKADTLVSKVQSLAPKVDAALAPSPAESNND